MNTTFAARPWRSTTLACLVATGTLLSTGAWADDTAHSFFAQEQARLATKKPSANETKKTAKVSAKIAAKRAPASARAKPAASRATARASSAGQHPVAAAPEALRAIVRSEAEANGVPVTVAKAVVSIESRWNPKVTGSAGEIGLMQIKYPTARMIGYTGTRAGLYDPATNIKWGMKYLAGAHRLAGGELCRTVSKYQGGHGVKGVTRMGSLYCAKARSIIASMPADVTTPRLALNKANEPHG